MQFIESWKTVLTYFKNCVIMGLPDEGKNKKGVYIMENMAFELMEAENTIQEDWERWKDEYEDFKEDMATNPYAPIDDIDYDIAIHPWDYI